MGEGVCGRGGAHRLGRGQGICLSVGGGGGGCTRPWWFALLACGGAYWPLALEPSAVTSRHPHYCGHPHCRGHPPSWVGIQNAPSAHGVHGGGGVIRRNPPQATPPPKTKKNYSEEKCNFE